MLSVIGLAVLVALTLGAFRLRFHLAVSELEKAGEPLYLSETVLPPLEPSANGYDAFTKAMGKLEIEDEDGNTFSSRYRDLTYEHDTFSDPDVLRQLFSLKEDVDVEGLLTLMEDALFAGSVRIPPMLSSDDSLHDVSEILSFFQSCGDLTEVLLTLGERDHAERVLLHAIKLERVIERQIMPITVLTNVAREAILASQIQKIWLAGGLKESEALNVLEMWAAENQQVAVKTMLKNERVFMTDIFLNEGFGDDDGISLFLGIDSAPLYLAKPYFMGCAPSVWAVYEKAGDWMLKPPYQRRLTIEDWVKDPPVWDRLSPILIKGVLSIAYKLDRHRTNLTLLKLSTSLYRHHQNHGRFPDSLDHIPLNQRIDPFSGDPYNYHLTSEGFLLYSVGPNQRDDGGHYELRNDDMDDIRWSSYRIEADTSDP